MRFSQGSTKLRQRCPACVNCAELEPEDRHFTLALACSANHLKELIKREGRGLIKNRCQKLVDFVGLLVKGSAEFNVDYGLIAQGDSCFVAAGCGADGKTNTYGQQQKKSDD